jgi:glutamate-ammonia-ligase adenylyltransferase
MISPQDLEDQIQTLCVFKQANILRVAAADVTGMLQLMRASDHLTEIAETVLNEVVELSWHHLTTKHGAPACRINDTPIDRGFAVIAYGKLGGIELGYASDLDLVFLHAGTKGQTDGGKPSIDNAYFFSRLGQRVIHMLTTHTTAGMLYEPDMRLRPSGKAGPLVIHIEGFKDYQMHNAWTWEHQALVRARPIIGETRMMKRFNQIRSTVLSLPRKQSKLRKEIVDMRNRLRKEQSTSDPSIFDLKQDTGGIVDIEFLVQYLVLLKAYEHNELSKWTDNVRILDTLSETGVLKDRTARLIKDAFLTYRAAVHALNLQEKQAVVPASRFRRLRETVQGIWDDVIGPA